MTRTDTRRGRCPSAARQPTLRGGDATLDTAPLFPLPRGARQPPTRTDVLVPMPYPTQCRCYCPCPACMEWECLDCTLEGPHGPDCPQCHETTMVVPGRGRRREALRCRGCGITWQTPGAGVAVVDPDMAACHSFGRVCHLAAGHGGPRLRDEVLPAQ